MRCKHCNKKLTQGQIKLNRTFCCRKCFLQNGKATSICHGCKEEYDTTKCRLRRGEKFCSKSCVFKGQGNPRWNGGKTVINGYIMITQPNHPYVTKKGYVMEHRLVMEKKLGRYLSREEKVHHINGKRNDNRIENLQLYPNQACHKKDEQEMAQLVKENFGTLESFKQFLDAIVVDKEDPMQRQAGLSI